MTLLHVTEVGRQVAVSGLLPHTAFYLLDYLARQSAELQALLPENARQPGDSSPFDYCLLNACLTAPEFSGIQRTRSLPEGFAVDVPNDLVERYAANLAEPRWQAYRKAANAAALLIDWLEGVPLRLLEERFAQVRAGTLRQLRQEVAGVLSELASILAAATQPHLSTGARPACLRARSETTLVSLHHLLAPMRRLVSRLDTGLSPALL